jgi:hypothetical protein
VTQVPSTLPSRGLAALFLAALVGVLLAGGIFVAHLGGRPALVGYAAVVTVLLGLGVARARRMLPAPAAARQTCACCDGDHSAPVRVV